MLGVIRGFFTHSKQSSQGGEAPVHWIVVAIAVGLEAEVLRSKLQSDGIPCLLKRESVGSVIGITLGPLGETQVLVPQEYTEQAMQLLNESESEQDSEDSTSDEGST